MTPKETLKNIKSKMTKGKKSYVQGMNSAIKTKVSLK